MKRKMKRTNAKASAKSTFYYDFCSSHILITFVGMTLLIVNYGVNTVQMAAVPHSNENCNNTSNTSTSSSCISSGSESGSGSKVLLTSNINGNNLDNKKSRLSEIILKRSNGNLQKIALPASPTVDDVKSLQFFDSNTNGSNLTATDLLTGKFRKARIFGLLGSNFSLSYNLTVGSGTSVANITVIAAPTPTPTYYYYAPAPSYSYYPSYDPNNPYGYYPYAYDPNAYNSYTYNPYTTYNPYAGYPYYG